MNEIQIFKNELFGEVRTTIINGEPWFVGRDVATALGYSKPENAISAHVHDDDKTSTLIQGSGSNYKSKAILINESGLYALIFGSKLEQAKEFKHWVTSDVLPSVRKHGMYAIDDIVNNPDLGIALLTQLKLEREKAKELQLTVAVKNQQIAEMRPKVTYYDAVLQCKDAIPISIIAKDYGWSASQMNQYLHDKKVQYKQGDIWLLYQHCADKGYTVSKTHTYPDSMGVQHTKPHTYWTQKGRLFIYDLLKSNGILPVIERSDAPIINIDDLPEW